MNGLSSSIAAAGDSELQAAHLNERQIAESLTDSLICSKKQSDLTKTT